MTIRLDIGDRVGRLVITGPIETEGKASYSPVRCDCGQERRVRRDGLRNGRVVSCGCLAREKFLARNTTHGQCPRGKRSPEYNAWASIMQRCTNEKSQAYKLYGARGIKVCCRWLKFENFLADMGKRPAGKSIERKDNNGNYTPKNCCWATHPEQMRNTRHNQMVDLHGDRMCATDAATKLGIPPGRIFWRIHKHGVTAQEALNAVMKVG